MKDRTALLQFASRKRLRSLVIREYMEKAGYETAVVFTCGNAAQALRSVGVDVLEIGAYGRLLPLDWWLPEDIRKAFPTFFDATAGHLPVPLMVRMARYYAGQLGDLDTGRTYQVPTGSGETIMCLQWAYPECRFQPLYNQADSATVYEKDAPLNYPLRSLKRAFVPTAKTDILDI